MPEDSQGNGSQGFGSLLRAVIDAIDDAVFVFDRDGRVAYASPSARDLLKGFAVRATPDAQLLPELLGLGGRLVPLRTGPDTVGEAVFLRCGTETGTLADRERLAILEALRATEGRVAAAAGKLGISRTTLWRRLKEYGVHRTGR